MIVPVVDSGMKETSQTSRILIPTCEIRSFPKTAFRAGEGEIFASIRPAVFSWKDVIDMMRKMTQPFGELAVFTQSESASPDERSEQLRH